MKSTLLILILLIAATPSWATPIFVTGVGTWSTDIDYAPFGPGASKGFLAGTSEDGRSVSVVLTLGNWPGQLSWGFSSPLGASCTIDGIQGMGSGMRFGDQRPVCRGMLGPTYGMVEIYDVVTSTVIVSEQMTGDFSFTKACGYGGYVCQGSWAVTAPVQVSVQTSFLAPLSAPIQAPIPEPSTFALLALWLVGLVGAKLKRGICT